MASMSNYLEEKLLKAVLNGEPFPSFPSVWLALALGTPFTDDSYASEASGQGYIRLQLTAAFTVADFGGGQWLGKNTDPLQLAEATGNYAAPVVGWGLMDSSVAGNLLIHGTCVSQTIVAGKSPYLKKEELVNEAR